jgi:hypothetical protein
MTKRKIGTLFAVVALATSTPAVAGPEHAHHGEKPGVPPPQTQPAQQQQATPTPTTPGMLLDQLLAIFGAVAVPRTLPTGAPACGNVATRTGTRRVCREPAAPDNTTARRGSQ